MEPELVYVESEFSESEIPKYEGTKFDLAKINFMLNLDLVPNKSSKDNAANQPHIKITKLSLQVFNEKMVKFREHRRQFQFRLNHNLQTQRNLPSLIPKRRLGEASRPGASNCKRKSASDQNAHSLAQIVEPPKTKPTTSTFKPFKVPNAKPVRNTNSASTLRIGHLQLADPKPSMAIPHNSRQIKPNPNPNQRINNLSSKCFAGKMCSTDVNTSAFLAMNINKEDPSHDP